MEAALKWGETPETRGPVARDGVTWKWVNMGPAKIELLHFMCMSTCIHIYIYTYRYVYMYNKIYCTVYVYVYVYIYIYIDPLPICLVYFATCLRTTMRLWAIHQGVEYLVYAESRLPSQSHSMVFVFFGWIFHLLGDFRKTYWVPMCQMFHVAASRRACFSQLLDSLQLTP